MIAQYFTQIHLGDMPMNPIKGATVAAVLAGTISFVSITRADEATFAAGFVREYYSQFQKPGYFVDDLMNFYTDDVLFADPTFEIVAEGKDEVRKLYADLGTDRTAYKNIRWTIRSIISQKDNIVIRGSWAGRFHECDFEIDFMTLWRIKGGKIAEQNDFFAASAFDRQVGWNGSTATCRS